MDTALALVAQIEKVVAEIREEGPYYLHGYVEFLEKALYELKKELAKRKSYE